MDERASILVQVLADTDAFWIPSRTWNRPRPTNVYFARRAFAKGGVPWESGGATEADRKATQRALEALAKSGAVKVRRPHRVKTLAVKLADAAEAETRKLVGLPGMYSAWLSACEVARHSKRYPQIELMTDLWVSERKLIGERPPDEYRREAVLVEEMMLPALVRNYVGSCADRDGRVYYALTPAGWDWLDAGDAPPADDLDGEPDRDARAFYYERVRAALDRLDTADPPDQKEIGGIPLPVAIAGLKLSAPWTPVAA
ncbi:MAG TPA: hypothetical protein PLQ87_06980 [Phycisphaerae bacterium]|nr:hypothetical protein [Phycisphaerae bacterium]